MSLRKIFDKCIFEMISCRVLPILLYNNPLFACSTLQSFVPIVSVHSCPTPLASLQSLLAWENIHNCNNHCNPKPWLLFNLISSASSYATITTTITTTTGGAVGGGGAVAIGTTIEIATTRACCVPTSSAWIPRAAAQQTKVSNSSELFSQQSLLSA